MFKKFLLSLFFLFVFPYSCVYCSPKKIIHFESNLTINQNASCNVSEKIAVYFDKPQIGYRFTRVLALSTSSQKIHYKVQQILINDIPIPFEAHEDANKFIIEMGDLTKTISPGIYIYTINYSAENALQISNDDSRLNWNVTGFDWNLPILKIEAEVLLPGTLTALQYQATIDDNKQTINNIYARKIANNHFSFATKSELLPGKSFIINLTFPKLTPTKISPPP